MTHSELVQRIKLLTITALMSDDLLMGILVFKGGNAIDLAYDLSNRGSVDIDFSMDRDFTEPEKNMIRKQATSLLNDEFNREGLTVFDVKFFDRPTKVKEAVKDFWGGYCLQFKTIQTEKAEKINHEIEQMRRESIAIAGNNSTVFEVDISKYEFIKDKQAKDIDGTIVYVYTPEMLAIEKLRALCQQNDGYRDIVISMTPKSRARDFYDIHNLIQSFKLDFKTGANILLCKHIFEAKRVPLSFAGELDLQRELHRQTWQSVVDTIDPREHLESFDYYFEFTKRAFQHLV